MIKIKPANVIEHNSLAIIEYRGQLLSMAFDETTWTMVMKARSEDEVESSLALESLCRSYWKPLYAWLRSSGHGTEDAEDLVQGFFSLAIKNEIFQQADSSKGRLRSFLLRSLKNYAANERRKMEADFRGGKMVKMPFHSDEIASEEAGYIQSEKTTEPRLSPADIYEKKWALTILQNANDRLREEFVAKDKGEVFDTLSPLLSGKDKAAENQDMNSVAAKLGISVSNATVQLHRLKKRFREAVEDEVRKTLAPDSDVEEEMGFLYQLLS